VKVEVSAWQHIYASVEREQSPHHREGFQTLFYSQSGLTEAEVREMEARLVYFSSDVEAVKHLFFTLSTGKIMVAQIVHLSEPDRMGRKGRYLAHNLVFEPRILYQIDSDPFLVFGQFPFITTVVGALEKGDVRTGDIPPVTFEVAMEPGRGVEAAATWSVQDLGRLSMLALRAERLADARSAVAFIGEPSQVESALEVAFFAVPAYARPRCSFDTYFHNCNLVDSYYWALGLLKPPSNRRLIRVDAQSRHLDGAVTDQPETAYERWVIAFIDERRLDDIGRYRDHAFAICEWLEGRPCNASLIDTAPAEVVDSVLQLNRPWIGAMLQKKLEEALPSILARRIVAHMGAQTGMVELLGQLGARFRLPSLLEVLYRIYEAQGFRAPQSDEIQAIGRLLHRADHVYLRLIHLCWTGQADSLHIELQLLKEHEYRQFVRMALQRGIVELWRLPVPGRGDAFLDQYLAPGGPAGYDLSALVRTLSRVGESACLSRLSALVHAQPEHEVRDMARFIVKQPDIPEPFRKAVGDALAALPPGRTRPLDGLRDRFSHSER
jgi:hypothetical protein